jgi:hypothetical protein
MGDLDERDVNRLETEYRRILDALVSSQGSRAEVHRAVRKRGLEKAWQAGSPKLESQARDLTAAAVRGWFGSDAKIPTLDSHLDALKDVVSEALPEAAEEFASVADALRRVRAGNQRNTKGPIERRTSLYKLGYISTPVASAGELDWDRLLLGSWVFDGDLPPYVHRQSDSLTIEALANPERKVVTITGSPKSGKTRSLIECLSRSPLKANDVYWLSPQPGAIELFLKNVPEGTLASAVVVLDDLQKFSFDPTNGLTLDRLERLSKAAKVLITLHDSSLASWKHSYNDHLSSHVLAPPWEVIRELEASRIGYSTRLSEDEHALADSLFAATVSNKNDTIDLASWLASVDYLRSALDLLRNGNKFEVALIGAIIDARILWADGASIDILKEYTRIHLGLMAPSALWSESNWEMAWDAVTTGASPNSPHAILVRALGDEVSFVVLDALWPTLIPASWNPWHLKEPGIQAWEAAMDAYMAGLPENIYADLFEVGMERGEVRAAFFRALVLLMQGHLERAGDVFASAMTAFDATTKDPLIGDVITAFGLQAMENEANGVAVEGFGVAEAGPLFQLALEVGCESGYTYFGLGGVRYAERRWVESEQLFTDSISRFGSQELQNIHDAEFMRRAEILLALNRLALGKVADVDLVQMEGNLRFWTRERDIHPLHPFFMGTSQLAFFYFVRCEYEKARDLAELCISRGVKGPWTAQANVIFGFLSMDEGRDSEGESYFRIAAEQGAIFPRFVLARILREKATGSEESERLYSELEVDFDKLAPDTVQELVNLFLIFDWCWDTFDLAWILRVTGHDVSPLP